MEETVCPNCNERVIPKEITCRETEEFQGALWFTGETFTQHICPKCGVNCDKQLVSADVEDLPF